MFHQVIMHYALLRPAQTYVCSSNMRAVLQVISHAVHRICQLRRFRPLRKPFLLPLERTFIIHSPYSNLSKMAPTITEKFVMAEEFESSHTGDEIDIPPSLHWRCDDLAAFFRTHDFSPELLVNPLREKVSIQCKQQIYNRTRI